MFLRVVSLMFIGSVCFGDSIKVGGSTLDRVVVTVTATDYIVKNPSDGTVQKICRKRADVRNIRLSVDRDALLKSWEAKQQRAHDNRAAETSVKPEFVTQGTYEKTGAGTRETLVLKGDPEVAKAAREAWEQERDEQLRRDTEAALTPEQREARRAAQAKEEQDQKAAQSEERRKDAIRQQVIKEEGAKSGWGKTFCGECGEQVFSYPKSQTGGKCPFCGAKWDQSWPSIR